MLEWLVQREANFASVDGSGKGIRVAKICNRRAMQLIEFEQGKANKKGG